MQSLIYRPSLTEKNNSLYDVNEIQQLVMRAFEFIAPTWPLKNLIAVNPLQGFENITFDHALAKGASLFQHRELHPGFQAVNRETIKWCQAYFDQGQAAIEMPLKKKGLYHCFRQMVFHDNLLLKVKKSNSEFIKSLPFSPEAAIAHCLNHLGIKKPDGEQFTIFLLCSLPGWASYLCYRAKWHDGDSTDASILPIDYIALRVIITTLLWPQGENLQWEYQNQLMTKAELNTLQTIRKIELNELAYHDWLFNQIKPHQPSHETATIPSAQLIFCIDVRSEPLRRAIESTGRYETFGFAGFFGIPVSIKNEFNNDTHASCPVLLKPKHIIHESISHENNRRYGFAIKHTVISKLQHLYQSLKYTFTTPFTLVDGLGLWSGLWMLTKSISPRLAAHIKSNIVEFPLADAPLEPMTEEHQGIKGINLTEQISYAETFLRMTGLINCFAPIIVLCAHGASTENNAYQSALDCGACGGHNGAPNARVLAAILNDVTVRKQLTANGIKIPESTLFIAGLHNTTTDEIKLYQVNSRHGSKALANLQADLTKATTLCSKERSFKLHTNHHKIKSRSQDWAETRPEWGLANNASFIIGPRKLTKEIDLKGRSFLHSYDWTIDPSGKLLTTIITAPMVVAQWINYQYLFSTLDNVSYGGGSKVTQNICGKIGMIQGNASDLMHGLPLQSVYASDHEPYHELVRLTSVIHAPRERITNIILTQSLILKFIANHWVHLVCLDPEDDKIYIMNPDLSWSLYKPQSE